MADSGDFKKQHKLKIFLARIIKRIFFSVSRKPACAKASAGRGWQGKRYSVTLIVKKVITI